MCMRNVYIYMNQVARKKSERQKEGNKEAQREAHRGRAALGRHLGETIHHVITVPFGAEQHEWGSAER